MKQKDIAGCRLVNQQISHATSKKPEEVVSLLGAMQAQDYLSALWAVGLRLPGSTQARIEQAIVLKKVVRTWPIRGTLHFVSFRDVRWMLALLKERQIPEYRRRIGFDEAVFKKGEKTLADAFGGQEQLTRKEIYRAFDETHVPALGKRDVQRHVIRRAAYKGLVCFGAHSGKQPRFALLDDWVPKGKNLERVRALAELAKRYFTGHGPATLKDFVWWSGLRVTDAKTGLKKASSQLLQETVDGVDYWMPENTEELQDASPTAYLLPAFDEYLVGYKNRSAVLNVQHAQKVVPGGNGMFLPIVLIDGQVVGTWKHTLKPDGVEIALKPFGRLNTECVDAVAVAAERYGLFLGKPAILKSGP